MRLFSQLFLRVVRGVEAERLCTDSGKLDASAIQLDIIAIIVTAVLLRANVVLVLLPDGGTEVVVAGSMVLVAVAFHRTHAEVTDAGHFFWQEQAQAKARQFGNTVLRSACSASVTAPLLEIVQQTSKSRNFCKLIGAMPTLARRVTPLSVT